MRHPHLFLTLFALFAAAFPAAAQTAGPRVAAPQYLANPRIVVFVANGAGGGSDASDNLRQVTTTERYPLVIREVRWCRKQHVGSDHKDVAAQFAAANRLAGWVSQLKAHSPETRVVLLGYSTGSRVVLAAAEMLPEGTLDRVVVIASSVSSAYDLRPALRASQLGVDSFSSNADPVLRNAEQTLGTADGRRGPMAGRAGFAYPCPPSECPEYGNFRQYRWQDKLGGQGGHAVWVHPLLLRRYVVPVILSSPETVVK